MERAVGIRPLVGLGLLALAYATPGPRAQDEVLWLSQGPRAAFEPAACVDDDGTLWALWIACSRGERPRGRIEGACVRDGGVVARFDLGDEAPWPAGLDVAPAAGGSGGALCVFEAGPEDGRVLVARALALEDGRVVLGPPETVPTAGAKPLAPRLARTADGHALAFQGLAGTDYDVFLAHRSTRSTRGTGSTGGAWGAARALLDTPEDEWGPRVAADGVGGLHVVFDRFDGASFDVVHARVPPADGDGSVATRVVAGGPDYQGFPDLSVGPDGSAWIAWETAASFGEGGGLRQARDLRLARLSPAGELAFADALPRRVKRRELPRVLAGARGPLVTYRSPVRADVAKDHLYTSWSTSTVRFEGGERPEETPLAGTDGNNDAEHALVLDRGGRPWMVFATDARTERFRAARDWSDAIEGRWRVGLRRLEAPNGAPELADTAPPGLRDADAEPPTRFDRASRAAVDGRFPWFGDLHRHTHLSRCSGAQDGTLADAYRYARGPGGLDFLAVTDHYQHVRPWSWWRSVRDVLRHHAPGSLVTFAAVERVRAERGHYNDVYLVPEEVPYDPDGWRRPPAVHAPVPAEHVVSIPHMMSIGRGTAFDWKEHDEDRTRLYEVFQGTRGAYEGPGLPYETLDGVEPETSIARGLELGAHFGLVASSDHVSSRTAFAGAWAEELTRASVFAALRARCTFAATVDRPVLARLGTLAMGERGRAADGATLEVELGRDAGRGLAYAELVEDGQVVERLAGEGAGETWILTQRRGLLLSGDPLVVRVEGGEIAAFGKRRGGEERLEVERRGDDAVALSRSGILAQDVWLELAWSGEGGALALELGDERARLPRDAVAPGTSRRHDLGRVSVLLWRQGAPLRDAPGTLAFEHRPRAGRSYYARVAWTDGNLAWTSPVRLEPGAEDAR